MVNKFVLLKTKLCLVFRMTIFIPNLDGTLLHKVIHSSEYSRPIFLGSDLSFSVKAQGVINLSHLSLVQSVHHVCSSPNISSMLLASAIEMDVQIKGLLQLSSFASDQNSHDALFTAAPEITNIFPSTEGHCKFSEEKLPKSLINETPFD